MPGTQAPELPDLGLVEDDFPGRRGDQAFERLVPATILAEQAADSPLQLLDHRRSSIVQVDLLQRIVTSVSGSKIRARLKTN